MTMSQIEQKVENLVLVFPLLLPIIDVEERRKGIGREKSERRKEQWGQPL